MITEMLILFGIALLISSIGFYRVVYFISIGYAFAIVAMAVVAPVMHVDTISAISVVQNLLLLIWGLRLGIFLVQRERSASYAQANSEIHERSGNTSIPIKFLIWVSVSFLYVLMFSPSLFGLINSTPNLSLGLSLAQIPGLLIMLGGLALEAVADWQKSFFKAKHPKQFVNQGLYRWVRCPNYLGEILFWVGNWVTSLVIFAGLWQWVGSLVGLICIVLIMMGSTKRLERTQIERYGSQSEYQEYIQTVPVLFPFVPIYSLQKIPVLLE